MAGVESSFGLQRRGPAFIKSRNRALVGKPKTKKRQPLILIVSNIANESANDLAGLFTPGSATVVTASDLNLTFGAAVSVGSFATSRMTIGGKTISAGRIRGVVSTISHFLPQEFYYINPADRAYVCSEVTAFFIYFLSEISCPILNPPTTRAISGLGLHRIAWLRAAHASGVPVWPLRLENETALDVVPAEGLDWARVTLVGDHPVEDDAREDLVGHMRVLSRLFRLPYLKGSFASRPGEGFRLAELSSVPDVSEPASRTAVVRYFENGGTS